MTGENDAALIQLAQLRADLSALQGQVTSNWVKITARFHQVNAQLEASGTATAELTEALAVLRSDIAALQGQLAGREGVSGEDGYSPVPAPRWWQLEGEERAAAIERLASWVASVYVPGYGALARALPACWREHTMCLYELDWMSETWGLLYLQPERGAGLLGAQAEWQTRLLPAAVGQMSAECRDCAHSAPALNGARR